MAGSEGRDVMGLRLTVESTRTSGAEMFFSSSRGWANEPKRPETALVGYGVSDWDP